MEEVVGHLLTEKKLKLAVAESCTGGLIGHRITNVAGQLGVLRGRVRHLFQRIENERPGRARGDPQRSWGGERGMRARNGGGRDGTGGRRRRDCDFGRGGTGRRQPGTSGGHGLYRIGGQGRYGVAQATSSAGIANGSRRSPGRWRSIGCGDMRWGCRSEVRRRFSGDRGRGKNRESFNLCETLEFKLFCAPRRLVSSARKLAWCEGFTLPTVKISSGPYERRGCDLPAFVKHGLRDQKEDV